MMSVTGLSDDLPGGGSMKTGPSLVDIITGLYTVIGIQGALGHRFASGRGRHVDVALFVCGVAVVAQQAIYYLLAGNLPAPIGNQANNGAPGGDFTCSDGRIMIVPGNQQDYERLCMTIGTWTVADLYKALIAASVPSSPINSVAQVMEYPQVLPRLSTATRIC